MASDRANEMSISCDCLNIVVRLRDSGTHVSQPIDIGMKNRLGFYARELYKSVVGHMDIKLPKLVKRRPCGSILINQCLNCGYDIYAQRDNLPSEIIFDREWISTVDELNAKKQNLNFSPFFEILINPLESDPDLFHSKGYEEKLSNDAKLWLEDQVAITEKRIEDYTNEQFANLDKLKKRVYQDYNIISKKIESLKLDTDINTNCRRLSDSDSVSHCGISPVILENEEGRDHEDLGYAAYQCDEVFFLDDIDSTNPSAQYYVHLPTREAEVQNRLEENDYDSSTTLMSRSLPLAVPRFISDKNVDLSDSPRVPADIAASIKALAQSLHGDQIFGDLPPPRFNAL